MAYSVKIKASAAKALKELDRSTREKLIYRIDQLKNNSHVGTVLKGELSGLRRIRIGTYRVIYELYESALTVLVIRIGHRREVYRRE